MCACTCALERAHMHKCTHTDCSIQGRRMPTAADAIAPARAPLHRCGRSTVCACVKSVRICVRTCMAHYWVTAWSDADTRARTWAISNLACGRGCVEFNGITTFKIPHGISCRARSSAVLPSSSRSSICAGRRLYQNTRCDASAHTHTHAYRAMRTEQT